MSTAASNQKNKNENRGFKYKTTFNNPPFELSLYSEPNVMSEIRYRCPKNAEVKVIDSSEKLFYKVIVNGYSEYISKKMVTKAILIKNYLH